MPRTLILLASTVLTAILSPSTIGVLGATDPAVCASSQLDWYTSVVGETPCVTYQRLRQICNSDYEVGIFNVNTPGDTCNDQDSACCCNSISFALSMLCMNCQYDTPAHENGIDAGIGAYGLYLHGCGPISNQTLPTRIQAAVCNKEIKIENDLYSLFWTDGPWFYVYTKETMEETFSATNNNSFTHCNSTSVNNTESGTPSSFPPITAGTGTPTQTTAFTMALVVAYRSDAGPIVGGVVGSVLGAVVVGLVVFFLLRKQRKNSGPKLLDLSREYQYEDAPRSSHDGPHVTPYTSTVGSVATKSRYGAGKHAQSKDPETFTLLPRNPPVLGSPDTNSSYAYGEHVRDYEDERHEDGGPVEALQRSSSGRLPPAYQSWESAAPESSVGYSAPNENMQEGSSSVSRTGSSRGSALRRVSGSRQQYLADVKRPLPKQASEGS